MYDMPRHAQYACKKYVEALHSRWEINQALNVCACQMLVKIDWFPGNLQKQKKMIGLLAASSHRSLLHHQEDPYRCELVCRLERQLDLLL